MQHQRELAYTHCNTQKVLFLICLGLLAMTARGAGIRELLISPDSSGPQITARLWTPCAAAAGPIAVDSVPNRLVIQGFKDCAPTKVRPFVCADPPGFDRADFHRKFNEQVLEFLRRNLPGKS
jgi:hypothetical protein